MAERRVPRIRFKGFEEDWEQRKLGEVINEITRTDENSDAPVMMITASDGFINQSERYSTDNAGQSLRRYILLERGELAYNHGASKLRPYGSCFALTTEEKARVPFVYHCFSTEKEEPELLSLVLNGKSVELQLKKIVSSGARMDGLLNISFEEYSSIPINLPVKLEQTKIVDFFRSLDKVLSLHQRKLEKLKILKKAMLEKMFPKNGAKVPEIRFSGFTDDWEQRKLSEVFTSYTDPVEIPHDGYERLGIRSHVKGTFHNYVPAGHELQTAQMHRVAANKFIVNITFGWEHAVAVTDENDEGKLVSHRFPQFSLSEELASQFLKFIIIDERFRHHLWLASPGGAGRNRVLNLSEMLKYEIQIPSVREQRKVADVLISLDSLLSLHQRKLEKLRQIKKSMLERMFV